MSRTITLVIEMEDEDVSDSTIVGYLESRALSLTVKSVSEGDAVDGTPQGSRWYPHG
jgi:hypothetical protein